MRSAAIAVLLLGAVAGADAQTLDLSGEVSLQARWYPESPAFRDQRSGTGGLVVEPTLYGEVGQETSFAFTPFYRKRCVGVTFCLGGYLRLHYVG